MDQRKAAVEGLYDWMASQGCLNWNWLSVVLEVSQSVTREQLQKMLRQTLIRFEIKVLGGNAVHRRHDRLRRLAVFGGEEWLHYHVLIEYRAKPADDPYEEWHLSSMEYEDLLGDAWRKEVVRTLGPDAGGYVFSERLCELRPEHHNWLNYTLRQEGSILGFGVDKIDLENTKLHPATDDVAVPDRI